MNFNDLKNNLNTLNREARIDELEKIKREIGRIEAEEGGDFLERPATEIIYEAQKIVEKRISELKGENNGQT